ncbi:MAG TPA: AAA family ATPase [Solirubrobacteraceae bacterium]|nr:AAA family ATPase [Solirubrobacteraceae bacterium]
MLRSLRLERARIENPSAFPFGLPAVRALADGLEFHPQVTFLIGENGSGKSTILEALATKLDLDARVGDAVMTFLEREADTPLPDALVLARGPRRPSTRSLLRAERFLGVAEEVDRHPSALAAHGGRPLHQMSQASRS